MTKNNIQNIWTRNWKLNMWLFVPSLWIGHTTAQWCVDRGSPVHYDTNTKKGNSGICQPECFSDPELSIITIDQIKYWLNQRFIDLKVVFFFISRSLNLSQCYSNQGGWCVCHNWQEVWEHRPGWQILKFTSNILLQWEKHCVPGIF